MKLLFDASALLNLIRILGEDSVKYLRENYILTLTPYEIGNALWKEATLLGTISIDEALTLLSYANRLYRILHMISPTNQPLVLRIAHTLRITYYDSAHIAAATENNLALVTDDEKLSKRIKTHRDSIHKLLHKEVHVLTTKELLHN